jgi:hypothetical protein
MDRAGKGSCRKMCHKLFYLALCVHKLMQLESSGITEYTELRPLLSGVHSVMRVKSVLAGEGGGCTPTPSQYIYPHQ